MRVFFALAIVMAIPRLGASSIDGAVPGSGPIRPCIPVASEPTRPGCAFDVEGRVLDFDGMPVPGVLVSDGAMQTRTDAHGFFDLYALGPRTHRVTAMYRSGCVTSRTVSIDAGAIVQAPPPIVTRLPCRQPSYESFGFAFVRNGTLNAIVRHGHRHAGDNGTLRWYHATPGSFASWSDVSSAPNEDERDAAGGITRQGAVVAFFGRFDLHAGAWNGIDFIRDGKDGRTTGSMWIGRNVRYHSPYGPLVVLPSGHLMQTFYGFDDHRSRVFVAFSSDDGRTWTQIQPIDNEPPYALTEAAAVFAGGRTDATSKIVLVARAQQRTSSGNRFGLVQYVSSNGGRSWHRLGWIPQTVANRESVPWAAPVANGRIAMVWADRSTMTLRRSISSYAQAFAGRWPQAVVMYRSKAGLAPNKNPGDFGYPSIASFGESDSQQVVLFSDVDLLGCSTEVTDVDLYTLPLLARETDGPARFST